MEIFERGEDVHTATASRVFGVAPEEIDPGMRSKAKMINYGIVYGLSDFGLADRLNIPREEAKEFIDAYLERFPRGGALHGRDDRAGARAGRRADAVGPPPPDPRAARAQLPGAHARASASPSTRSIQGTAADIIKLAMVRCHRALAEAGAAHAPDARRSTTSCCSRGRRRRRRRRAS